MAKESVAPAKSNNIFAGFFAKKYAQDEKISSEIKKPKLWGALLGELIGTMLLTLAMMTTLGVWRADLSPLFMAGVVFAVYVVIVKISGANLNPLVTVGMMATRRMPVVRGVLYIIAQMLGAGLGFFILNAFKMAGGSELEIPIALTAVDGESFWPVMWIELFGAVVTGICFARVLKLGKKNVLGFAMMMMSVTFLVFLISMVVLQGFYMMSGGTLVNPALAVAYGVFSVEGGDFGLMMLTFLAYILVPMVGGVLGFYISDIVSRVAACDEGISYLPEE